MIADFNAQLEHDHTDSQDAIATLNAPAPPLAARGKARRLAQILAMQDALYAITLNGGAEARERAQSACAWERLEVQRRKLLGIPDPGAYRPDSTAKKKRKAPPPSPDLPGPPEPSA